MLAICSRSPSDNDRVLRLRRVSTNFPSAALTAGSAGGATESPRVSGFLGATGLRLWSAVTPSAADATPAVIDSAAPARIAPNARRLRRPDRFVEDSLVIVLT